MKLSPDKKLAGILCPVFSIRTEDDLGIGDTLAGRHVRLRLMRHEAIQQAPLRIARAHCPMFPPYCGSTRIVLMRERSGISVLS